MQRHASHERARAGSRNRAGSALVLSLVAVVVVSMLAATFLQVAASLTRRQGQSVDLKQAVYVAEAGLAEAYIGLGVARTGNVGTMENPAGFGGGLFWVEAEAVSADLVELESTGMWGAGRATLGLVVERVEASPATLGAFSTADLMIHPGSLIDSYDSTAGSYASQALSGANNFEALLGTDGALGIDGGTKGAEIRGNATPGVGEGVTATGTVTISGSTSPRATSVALPPPVVPAIPLAGPLFHNDPLPLVLPAGELGYESLHIGSGGEVILQGPGTLVVGHLILDSDANLQLDVDAGPLDIYVTESLELNSGASVTNSREDPTRVTMQVTADAPGSKNVQLNSDTSFFGTLYAPLSEVQASSGFEVFGAIIANSLNLSSGAQIHIDLAFGSIENNLPKLQAWRVVDIPDAVAKSGRDPFVTLGVDKLALRTPLDAHQDQELILDYVDLAGAARIYNGWESGFDWTDVSTIVSGTRDGASFTHVTVPVASPSPTPPPGSPMDWIADTSISSSDLVGFLIEASPLVAADVDAALERVPPMDSQDLMDLMAANTPLGMGSLWIVLETAPLSNAEITTVLMDYPALPPAYLADVIDVSSLTDAQIRDVLILNAPLNGGVKNTLTSKSPPMNQADKDLVMAVW